jgi:hypothetical protein
MKFERHYYQKGFISQTGDTKPPFYQELTPRQKQRYDYDDDLNGFRYMSRENVLELILKEVGQRGAKAEERRQQRWDNIQVLRKAHRENLVEGEIKDTTYLLPFGRGICGRETLVDRALDLMFCHEFTIADNVIVVNLLRPIADIPSYTYKANLPVK